MRILIFASGSRGDVQPYVALGKGLKAAGHFVRILTHQNYASLVSSQGLELWPLAGNVQDIVETTEMQARVEKGNFIFLMAQMAKEAEARAVELAQAGLAASQGMDLLIAGMGGLYIGLALAEKLKLPLLQAYLVPFTPTRYFPGALTPGLPAWVGPSLYRLSHQLVRQALWQGFRAADGLARQKVLDLPPAPFWGPYPSDRACSLPTIYGISPSVIQPPPDWGKNIHVTGYWHLEAGENWSPPDDLLDFLDAGPSPVYIGFGSMSSRNPEETAALVLQALSKSNQRAVLLSGWGGLGKVNLPDTVYMIDSVPHAWLFPRLSAVVHHGGAGTTGAGLRAGISSVIIPFFGDQPFWGWRIAELGVGPDPIPRRQLSSEKLAQAIHKAVTNKEMSGRAARLGARIRAEDGIARAVEIIETVR